VISKKTFEILGWVLFFEVISYFLGSITQENSANWYQTLNKSSLTPPAIIFPIVWSILYAILAFAGYSLWQNRSQPAIKLALSFYVVQMLMNWIWTPLFFYFHFVVFSFFWIVMMVLLTLTIIYLTKDRLRFTSVIFMPYFFWLIFAAYLNGVIWIINA